MRFNIFATKGSFATLAQAARGEDELDWLKPEGPDHDACTLAFAAKELTDMLRRISGVNTDMSDDMAKADSANCILLFTRSQFADCDAAVKGWFGDIALPDAPQSFVIKSIQGKPSRSSVSYLILGADRAGALYGAYELLARLGFRWFSPDSWDESIPPAIDPLPAVDEYIAPDFITRGFFSPEDRGNKNFLLWMVRNRMNLWTAATKHFNFCKKLGMRFTGGTHDLFDKYLSPRKYFDQHPEWYCLVGKKRSSNIKGNLGDNICFSNQEACEFFADKLVDDLVDGDFARADFVNIWPLDNGQYCACSECRKLGNATNHILILAHYCRKAVNSALAAGRLLRDVKLVIPAYHETLPPPSKPLPADFDYEGIIVVFFPIERCYVHTFDSPLCHEINRDLLEYWEQWTNKDGRQWNMLMGEYYNVSAFAAIAAPVHDIMSHDIPFYFKSGTRHMHYMHVTTALWGTLALTNCMFAALLWNTDLDPKEYLQDFFQKRYNAFAPLMATFYDVLQQAMQNSKALKHYVGMQRHSLYIDSLQLKGSPDKPSVIFGTRHFSYNNLMAGNDCGPSIVETMLLMEQAGNILDKALLECEDPVVGKRILWDARRFRYTRNLVRFYYHFIRLRLFENRGFEEQARLEAMALRDIGEALRRELDMTRHIRGKEFKYPELYVNGLTATWLPRAYAQVMADYELDTPDTPGGRLLTNDKDHAFA